MPQSYSNPKREADSASLPNIEYWYHDPADHENRNSFCIGNEEMETDGEGCPGPGWYWWSCFPGCTPDGEANGPFATEEECIADFQDEQDDNDDDEPTETCGRCGEPWPCTVVGSPGRYSPLEVALHARTDEQNDDEQDESTGPEDDDYIITTAGPLGSRYHVNQGSKTLATFIERADVDAFILKRMGDEQFWPNVWSMSDHGNLQLVTSYFDWMMKNAGRSGKLRVIREAYKTGKETYNL